MIRFLKRLFNRKPTRALGVDCYTLTLIRDDGLPQVQDYDTEEEAIQAGESQLGGFGDLAVRSYNVTPFSAALAVASNRRARHPYDDE